MPACQVSNILQLRSYFFNNSDLENGKLSSTLSFENIVFSTKHIWKFRRNVGFYFLKRPNQGGLRENVGRAKRDLEDFFLPKMLTTIETKKIHWSCHPIKRGCIDLCSEGVEAPYRRVNIFSLKRLGQSCTKRTAFDILSQWTGREPQITETSRFSSDSVCSSRKVPPKSDSLRHSVADQSCF
jgi:hypothetical protein